MTREARYPHPSGRTYAEPSASGRLGAGEPPPDVAGSYGAIFRVAGPLIFASIGLMLMYFVDGLFLAWHSQEAIAAVVPAGMMAWLIKSPFLGVVGYVGTLVAHYVGAGRPERVGRTVWQGLHLAVVSGAIVAAMALMAGPVLDWVGHEPAVRRLEVRYLQIICWGAPLTLSARALSGFFTGRGDVWTLMAVQLFAFAVNAVLDYGLIFGHWGLPAWGITGAATATVVAQGVAAVLLLVVFWRPAHRRRYGTWRKRGLERDLLVRLIRFGLPNGARITVDVAAWSLFLVLIGRLGQTELAASNIAWRINGLAFFPIIGLSTAIGILVGQAQGRRLPDLAARITGRGLAMAEVWMIGAALLFLFLPRSLFGLFHDPRTVAPEQFARITEMGVILLRLVALYSLLDAFNIVLAGALQGAGDTRWTFLVSLALHTAFALVLILAAAVYPSLYLTWFLATAFVMAQALVWLARFRSGRWRAIEVIERVDTGHPDQSRAKSGQGSADPGLWTLDSGLERSEPSEH